MRVRKSNRTATAVPCAYLCHLTNGLPEVRSFFWAFWALPSLFVFDLERLHLAFGLGIQPSFNRATAVTVFSTALLDRPTCASSCLFEVNMSERHRGSGLCCRMCHGM